MKTLAAFMKSKRSGLRRNGHPEQDLQDALLGTLKRQGIFAFPLPNHGKMGKNGRYNRVEKHHVAGVPDLAVALPHGRLLWVELKSAEGRPSNEQIAFHLRLTVLGHKAMFAWTADEVIEELRRLGAYS